MSIIKQPQHLWQRQPKEPDSAWMAFLLWRDAGPTRSRKQTAELVGKSKTTIDGMAAKWNWVERAASYDSHMDDVRVKAQEDAIVQMSKRQIALARGLQNLGGSVIIDLVKRAAAGEKINVSADTARRLASDGIKLERLIMGEPDQVIGQKDPTKMTWADLLDDIEQET